MTICRSRRNRRYSESSMLSNDHRRMGVASSSASQRVDTPTTILDDYYDYRERARRHKADSVHDLRRSTVSSVLRLPPSTPPRSASSNRANTAGQRGIFRVASALPTTGSPYMLDGQSCASSRDDFATLLTNARRGFGTGSKSVSSGLGNAGGPGSAAPAISGRKKFLKRMLRWPPQLVVLPPSEDEYLTEIRGGRYAPHNPESYALDEVNAFNIVPKSKNVNYHKRVSL